jgi:hypothetical protein
MKGDILRYKHIEANLCSNIEIKDRIPCSFLHQACLLKFVPYLFMSLLFKTHIRFFIIMHFFLLIPFVDLDILVLFFNI